MQRRSLPILGAAMVGVVVGHSLAYLGALPAGGRQAVLLNTGHAYWSGAVFAALLAGSAAAGAVAVRNFRVGLTGLPVNRPGYLAIGWRLAVLQVGIFSALEFTERLASGVPLANMLHGDLFPIGLVLQVVVAAAGAFLLTLLARAAEAMGALFRPWHRARAVSVEIPPYSHVAGGTSLYGASRTRGPPHIPRLQV